MISCPGLIFKTDSRSSSIIYVHFHIHVGQFVQYASKTKAGDHNGHNNKEKKKAEAIAWKTNKTQKEDEPEKEKRHTFLEEHEFLGSAPYENPL